LGKRRRKLKIGLVSQYNQGAEGDYGKKYQNRNRAVLLFLIETPEDERGVMTAKTERIGQNNLRLVLARPEGYIVQVATLGRGSSRVDRRREACP